MAFNWDLREYMEDVHRCAVCRTESLPEWEYVCSPTCSDILQLRQVVNCDE